MTKKFILACMAMGILAGGVHNDLSAMNQTAENQQIQERVLTESDAQALIEAMQARGSTELVIPEGYTSIGRNAFAGVDCFSSVIIPLVLIVSAAS